MMHIKKAVITAAARGGRLYPVADTVQKAMFPLIDADNLHKPVIQIIAEEAFSSGIEEIAVVCAPGDGERYKAAFFSLKTNLAQSFRDSAWAKNECDKIDHLLANITFIEQSDPLGYGHAVSCARSFVGDEPFLLMLGDYIYISSLAGKRCAAQLVELATRENCSVSAVNPTIEYQISRYGTVTGKQIPGQPGVYTIEKIIEKPSLSTAEIHLQTPGLRMGYYLCFFGMHVLTASVFTYLEKALAAGEGSVLLTPALEQMAENEKYLAMEMKGSRYDLSGRTGLLKAQIALGLAGDACQETLSVLVEMLAEANMRTKQ